MSANKRQWSSAPHLPTPQVQVRQPYADQVRSQGHNTGRFGLQLLLQTDLPVLGHATIPHRLQAFASRVIEHGRPAAHFPVPRGTAGVFARLVAFGPPAFPFHWDHYPIHRQGQHRRFLRDGFLLAQGFFPLQPVGFPVRDKVLGNRSRLLRDGDRPPNSIITA